MTFPPHFIPLIFSLLLAVGLTPLVAQEDQQIAEAVERELLQFAPSDAVEADVNVEEGIVTLSGTAESLPLKRMATDAIETVRGVRSIVDRLRIREMEREDSQIAADINRLFENQLGYDDDPIETRVENGVVTLIGEVSTFELHELAETMAESIVGVRSVANLLKVKPLTPSTDEEIEQHLQLRLAGDPWIDQTLVRVEVNDGAVRLAGKVDTMSERSRLFDMARVYGVQGIDASRLLVDPRVRAEWRRAHEPVYRPDDEIAESIRQAFRQDPRIEDSNPTVEVIDGEATLAGAMDSIGAKSAAESDASDTPGVEQVYSLLYVEPDTEITDAQLRDSLDSVFETDALLHGAEIDPAVDNGVVTLEGEVEAKYQRRRASKLAAFAVGVEQVKNRLRVQWDTPGEYEDEVPKSDAAVE